MADYEGAKVIHSDRPSQPIVLTPHDDCRYVAVSRDGKWAATASHFGSKVKVWDAATGNLVQTLPVESSSWVRFSPDGRWLATPVGTRHLGRSELGRQDRIWAASWLAFRMMDDWSPSTTFRVLSICSTRITRESTCASNIRLAMALIAISLLPTALS